MKRITLILVVIALLTLNTKAQKQAFNGATYVCNFETLQGRLNGNYVSYYKNGKKKAEGKFENNCRKGIWTVWDTTGRLRMQRDYENILCFNRIIPAFPTDKNIELLNTPKYTLQYNKDGYIQCSDVKERMVVWDTRIWRLISPQDNQLLFDNNKLLEIISTYIKNKGEVYKDEELTKKLDIKAFDASIYKVVGFKIKEDQFLDNDRQVSDVRIIGISLILIEKETNVTSDLGWIYFPDFRKTLAQEKMNDATVPAYIKSYDDLFFFRYFYGQIQKQSNMNDFYITNYKFTKEEIDKEALRIDMDIIDTEHDFWISLTK